MIKNITSLNWKFCPIYQDYELEVYYDRNVGSIYLKKSWNNNHYLHFSLNAQKLRTLYLQCNFPIWFSSVNEGKAQIEYFLSRIEELALFI